MPARRSVRCHYRTPLPWAGSFSRTRTHARTRTTRARAHARTRTRPAGCAPRSAFWTPRLLRYAQRTHFARTLHAAGTSTGAVG
jgi:hypothetical protein